MNLDTIRKLWWKVGLLNVVWCAALWVINIGAAAQVPFLGSIDPRTDPPIYGPLIALPLLIFCGWLGQRHVARSVAETPQVAGLNRLPQPPELTLEGRDGLIVRLLLGSVVYLFPLAACTHFLRKLLMGAVYKKGGGEAISDVWSIGHLTVRDDYRFERGPTYFPIIQPLLYLAGFAFAIWLIVRLVCAAQRARPVTRSSDNGGKNVAIPPLAADDRRSVSGG
ncbi:MAG: hypothetical protein QOF78_4162 [Phycisphaerales bacterium]|nr:hypothetical protein [Phycisphaerales bacterium]